jgi:hypothetical protein
LPAKETKRVVKFCRDEKALKEARAIQEKLRSQVKQLQSELEESRAREQSCLETNKSKVLKYIYVLFVYLNSLLYIM